MRRTGIASLLAAGLFLLGGAPALAEKTKPIETFKAFAASLGTGKAGVIDITINRWSTDEEREMLLTTLQEFGADKLLDALMKIRPPVGYMRTPNSLGYDLFYARNQATSDGGRRVVLATNRRVAFREAATSTRSMQYQFTLIEVHLDKDGKGEGKMVPAAKVGWDKEAKKLEIENYNAMPVDLLNVTAKTP
ncbi:MAG: hypothetical protein ACRD3M_02255 [Thermoanaerobaculia bacterium]